VTAIGITKDSSIASIIAVHELTYAARELSTNHFRVFEGWLTAGVLYLVLTGSIGLAGRALEYRLALPAGAPTR
jgi:ABC-type amino acid transport system permease subunit